MTPEEEIKAKVIAMIKADMGSGGALPTYPKTTEEGIAQIKKELRKSKEATPISQFNLATGRGLPQEEPAYSNRPGDYPLTTSALQEELKRANEKNELGQSIGKLPLRMMPPEAREKEMFKAKVMGMIQDDMIKQMPTDMQAKFAPQITVERGTLTEEQRLKGAKPGMATYDPRNRGIDMFPGKPLAGGILEKERQGEKLSALERAGLAVHYGVRSLTDTMTGGFTKELTPRTVVDYEPQHVESMISSAVGSIVGLGVVGYGKGIDRKEIVGIPAALGKAYRGLVDAKLIPHIMASKTLSPMMKSVLIRATHGAGLGAVLAGSQMADKETIPDNLLHGALLGEAFAIGSSVLPKGKLLGVLLRNVATRVAAAPIGQYSGAVYKDAADLLSGKEVSPDALQHIFDEGLMWFFSHKGTTREQMLEILPKLKKAQAEKAAAGVKAEEILGALAGKRQAGLAEAKELGKIKVNPDIVHLGELIAEYDYAKTMGAAVPRLQKQMAEIVSLHSKIRGGLREGEVMPEEMGAMAKAEQKVPSLAPKPSVRPTEQPVPAPEAPPAAPVAGKQYTTTVTARSAKGPAPVVPPAAPERTPVIPPAMLKGLHTAEHFVYSNGEYAKTEGKDVEIVEGVDTFLHKSGKTWSVVDGKSGTPIGFGTNRQEAIDMARGEISKPEYADAAEKLATSRGESPRYSQAQGAGTLSFIDKPVIDVPEDLTKIEQGILAKSTGGTSSTTAPLTLTSDPVNSFRSSEASTFIDSGGFDKKPGFVSQKSGTKNWKIVRRLRRPYGYLENTGGDTWRMVLDPGVSVESLKAQPSLPTEPVAPAPAEAPKPAAPQKRLTKGEIIAEIRRQQEAEKVAAAQAKGGKTIAEQVAAQMKGVKGSKEHPLTTRKRRNLERELGEEIEKLQAEVDPELFKLEMGFPAEMATPEQVKEWRTKQPDKPAEATTTEPAKPLSLTSEQMKMGAEDFDRFTDWVEGAIKKGSKPGPGLTIKSLKDIIMEAEEKGLGSELPGWYKFMSTERRPLPKQPEIPRTGRGIPAVMTDDGGIYPGRDLREWHAEIVKRYGIPPERLVSGGYINDGAYEADHRSNVWSMIEAGRDVIVQEAKRKWKEELDTAKIQAALKANPKGIKGLNLVSLKDMMVEAELRGQREDKAMLGFLKSAADKEKAPPIPEEGQSEVTNQPEKSWRIGRKVVTNLRRMGPGGQKGAQAFMDYARNRMQWLQRDLYGAANVAHIVEGNTEFGSRAKPSKFAFKARSADYKARSEATGKRLREIIEGKIKPADDIEANAVQIIKERIKEIGDEAERLGLKIHNIFGEKKWKSIQNYYPHEWLGLKELWDGEIGRNFKDAIVEKIAKEMSPDLYNDPVTKDRAIEKAQRYWEDFRTDLKTARYGHLEMQRILTDPFVESMKKKWEAKFPDKPFPLRLNDDISVLYRYFAGANNRIAWLQQFGQDVHNDKWGMVPEKILKWTEEMENPVNRKWMVERFKDIIRKGNEGAWQKVSSAVQTWQLFKMAFASIPNMGQWATNTVPNITTKAAIEASWDTLKYAGFAGKEAKAKAREFFSATGAGRLSAEMQQAMSRDPSKYARVADSILKLYGFTGTEFYNRLYSSFAGKRYAEHLGEKLQKSGSLGWRSPQYIRELNKLGFSEADVQRLIKDGPWFEKDAEKLAQAGYEMTRITQFMTDSFFLPSTWADPRIRIATQFKNFAYNQTSLLYSEPLKQAIDFARTGVRRMRTGQGEVVGDLVPMMKTAMILPIAGMLVYNFKKEMYKLLGLTFYDKMLAGKSEPLKWFSYIFNAGGFGIGSDIVTSLAMGKSGITNLVGGPTISDVFEFVDAVGKTYNDLTVAFNNSNAKWLGHRSETIAGYWRKFAGKVNPLAKMTLGWFSNEYQKVNDFGQFSRLARDMFRKYKEAYMLQSPAVAEEIWQGFQNMYEAQYEQVTGRKLQKPTKRDVQRWWNEIGSEPSERIPLSGKKKSKSLGEFYY